MGGKPVWLDPEHLPAALSCRTCQVVRQRENNNNHNRPTTTSTATIMRFVCQLYAPVEYDDGRAFHRSLYVFACPVCCNNNNLSKNKVGGGGEGAIRVLRTQLPVQNPYYPNQEEEQQQQRSKETDITATATTTEKRDAQITSTILLEDEEIHKNWQRHHPTYWNDQHLCVVCGQLAVGRCPVQKEYFCGPMHQREYKKHALHGRGDHHQKNAATATSCTSYLPSVYHMTELVVEEEPEELSNTSADANDNAIRSRQYDHSDDSDDSDADLEQEDLNEMLKGNNSSVSHCHNKNVTKMTSDDPTTVQFFQRIRERPNVADQCLRYCRWPTAATNTTVTSTATTHSVLWCKSSPCPPEIQPCPYCGGPRGFEFQLMPQMLHFLLRNHRQMMAPPHDNDYTQLKQVLQQTESLVQQAPPEQIPPALMDARNAAVRRVQDEFLNGSSSAATTKTQNGALEIDWGVVAVYTCQNSCVAGNSPAPPELGGYREEYAWVQSSLDR